MRRDLPVPARSTLVRVMLAAIAAGAILGGAAPASAVLPHEGGFTPKQMAGMAIGFLSSEEARACGRSVARADALVDRLIRHYGFDKDDVEEDSPFGKRFVARGRIIAGQDARQPTFCEDVSFEIDQDTVELLPH